MITIQEIEKLAALARITVPQDEKESLRKDIEAILGYVGEIQKVSADLGEARPAFVPNFGEASKPLLRNVMREDGEPHEKGIFTEELLQSAPNREGQYIRVKKIL